MSNEEENVSQERLAEVVQSAVVDAVTVEVVGALREADERCILLRGASTAKWLYSGVPRGYGDVDLLVDPARFAACERVLARLGFVESPLEVAFAKGRPQHAATWERGQAVVDLHRALAGVGVSAEEAWPILAGCTERSTVGETGLEVLAPHGRALVIALHAAQHGTAFANTREDLERALAQLPIAVWQEAASLARLLEAEAVMAAGLGSIPRGFQLAAQLGLPEGRAPREGSNSFHVVQGLHWLLQTPGLYGKARFLGEKLFPPTTLMRNRSSLARRGRVGLGAAYGLRLGSFVQHVPATAREFLRLRRDRRLAALSSPTSRQARDEVEGLDATSEDLGEAGR